MDPQLKKLILSLHDIGAIKLGEFTLKSGLVSPIYIDLRLIVSYPEVLQAVADQMWSLLKNVGFDNICGVPYTALPIATALSLQHDVPMLMRRKEVKKYGTKKMIEGVFKKGERCLVVEDLVTSGISVFETVEPLRNLGLKCTDVVVLVNRQQGGETNLNAGGLRLHAVITIDNLLATLLGEGRIDTKVVDRVHAFIRANQTTNKYKPSTGAPAPAPTPSTALTYGQRSTMTSNKMAQTMLELMEKKRTNLCFSADVTDKAKLLYLVDQVGPHICLLKTHIDIVEGFDHKLVAELQRLAKKHNFLLFEDRKYADIGNTVVGQYSKGVYRTVEWADIINAHGVPGPGIVAGLKKVGLAANAPRGLLLIAQMSSKGNLCSAQYCKDSVKMAEENKDFCMGFICQEKLSQDPGMIHMTPGVKMVKGGDNMGQQYNTPKRVIIEKGVDMIIVGRGIYGSSDPSAAAAQYRAAGWQAYETRLRSSKL